MSDKELSWRFVEERVSEDVDIERARHASLEHGIDPITASAGQYIATIATALDATTIMEIGTGLGVGTIWLAHACPGAHVTSIDSEMDHHVSVRELLNAAEIPASRVRLITEKALDVLPKMNESSYDLVVIDADYQNVQAYVDHGISLVKPRGSVIVAGVLGDDLVADPAKRDDKTSAYRWLLQALEDRNDIVHTLNLIGDGLVHIVRLPDTD
ncbi:MAG: methyltransferase domain-containing protein [Microbacteriaceae bacterium]|jgi:predicted O-methyltransferase YrrM|nr:methyltransferase domain-containing protein [Microbacteriaceae bacterium]